MRFKPMDIVFSDNLWLANVRKPKRSLLNRLRCFSVRWLNGPMVLVPITWPIHPETNITHYIVRHNEARHVTATNAITLDLPANQFHRVSVTAVNVFGLESRPSYSPIFNTFGFPVWYSSNLVDWTLTEAMPSNAVGFFKWDFEAIKPE